MGRAVERYAREGLGCEVSRRDYFSYRLVNKVGRGGTMTINRATEWLRSHGLNVKAADKFVPQAIFKAPKENVRTFLQALFSGDGSIQKHGDGIFLEYYSMSRRLIEDVHHLLLRFGIVSLIREKLTPQGKTACRIQITDRSQVKRFAELIGFWPGCLKQHRLEGYMLEPILLQPKRKSNFDTLPSEALSLMHTTAKSLGSNLRRLGVEGLSSKQSIPLAKADLIAYAAPDTGFAELVLVGPVWDVVEHIEFIGEEEVYDLAVPGLENFLANDIVLHNSTYARCGLIVNVTPLEPEWEGHLTLEISNTTPLPAKVYANEGIAQLLFLGGDGICEMSYADKKGKYQAQDKITLPKIER